MTATLPPAPTTLAAPPASEAEAPLLSVEGLTVDFYTRRGLVHAVRGVSFSLGKGAALGLVGESGCGKSVTSQAIMGLIHLPGEITGGDISWKGRSLLGPAAAAYRRQVCGGEIAIVFQDPMTSLDPLFSIGRQIGEVLVCHKGMEPAKARVRALELLDLVRINAPERRFRQLPHALSGGMRQRALIAMALASEPELLIADEPTTALDVTVQAQILDLLIDLRQRLGLAVLMITHDLGVVARLCQQVAVMYAGTVVERDRADAVLLRPAHPYARGLLRSTPALETRLDRLLTIDGQPPDLRRPPQGCAFLPRCARGTDSCRTRPPLGPKRGGTGGRVACWHPVTEPETVPAAASPAGESAAVRPDPLVAVEGLTVHFPAGRDGLFGPRRVVQAVDGVSFTVRAGETLGLVGESGSGKTTTGRAILRRAPITRGDVRYRGQSITTLTGEPLRRLRRDMQLIFQDPYASLNPRMTVFDIVAEPLIVHGLAPDKRALRDRVVDLLALVGLPADAVTRHPHAFSGGQRQRIGIARALTLEPAFIVADEPVSALDVSIRAQVVNLMQDLQARLGLTYLFIAHDLAVVRHIADRVAIMYAGQIVELGDRDRVYADPRHPYTETLLAAVPPVDPRAEIRPTRPGEVPSPLAPPPGCRFASRCPLVTDQCRAAPPPLSPRADGHLLACWHR